MIILRDHVKTLMSVQAEVSIIATHRPLVQTLLVVIIVPARVATVEMVQHVRMWMSVHSTPILATQITVLIVQTLLVVLTAEVVNK